MTYPDDRQPTEVPLILLVSSHEWSSRSLETLISPAGFVTRHAYTGQQAIALAAATNPHAALVDRSLPDMSGLEVVHQLRRVTAADLPVFLISTTTPPRAQRLEAFESGVLDLLTGPIDVEVLVARLSAAIRLRRSAAAPPTALP